MRCCEGVAPAGVAPHLGLAAQPLHGVVEHLEHELGVDHLVDDAACGEQVDLRLLHLDHRAAGVGEVMQLLVEHVGERHDARGQVLVVLVLHREGHELGGHRAELDRLGGEPLGGLPQLGVLHLAAAHRPDDLRHHARFEVVVQDVPAREGDAAGTGARELRVRVVESGHVVRRIARPALAAHVLVEAAVAVGADVEAGELLLAQVDRERIGVLLAKARVHHRVEERARAEVLGVPARPRQRSDDGSGQHDIGGCGEHFLLLLLARASRASG
ncbi:MAG: hypothetical protein M5U08_01795 [Burkholderiales bacterium]|nr:hypothetical protein [Burkholderiales bacterium]